MLETMTEEITVTVRCEKGGFAREWSARAELSASSTGAARVVGLGTGSSRTKAAQEAVSVAFEVYDARRPKRWRKGK